MEFNQPSQIVKDLNFGEDAKSKVINGVEKLAKAVKSTLGASGKCVIYEDARGNPVITKDGVTILPYEENTIIFDTRSLSSYRRNPIKFDIKDFLRIHVFDQLFSKTIEYLEEYPLENVDNIVIVDEGSNEISKTTLHYKLFEDLSQFLTDKKVDIYLLKGGF